MKRTIITGLASLTLVSLVALAAGNNSKISGSYVEVRGQDVFIGACFANSETGLVGREGTMAWNIKDGAYNGVSLKGLSVAVAMLGKSTLGDKFSNPFPIKSVLFLDEQATEAQRAALRGFAREAAGPMLGTVVREEVVPVTFEQTQCAVTEEIDHEGHHAAHGPAACVTVKAGSMLTVQTRSLRHSDSLCANPEVHYAPMARGMKHETTVFAEQMIFQGKGLDSVWSIPAKRNGYVADFEINVSRPTTDAGHHQ